jgi:hypothetical protein
MLCAVSARVERQRYFLASSTAGSNHLWMNPKLQAKNIAGEKGWAYRRNT